MSKSLELDPEEPVDPELEELDPEELLPSSRPR